MGFSVKQMIEELEAIFISEFPNKKKLKLLRKQIQESKEYAEQCGQLN